MMLDVKEENLSEKKEFTLRVIVLAFFLTVVLAMSNAFLALKLGLLTSASIPAAIISMGILKFFRNSSIFENNLVQTAASAGEAVAGGIVYTIPALVIIQYWHHFDYWTNFWIAFIGGSLGVFFSVPLRRILVHDKSLSFPEGVAIAEVLKSSLYTSGLRDILAGGLVGAFAELLQLAFKVVASSFQHWFLVGRSLFSFGGGFSTAMIGAGFLIGGEMALSIFFGAILSNLLILPLVSYYADFGNTLSSDASLSFQAGNFWAENMRYVGIGAMLFAGIWSFLGLLRPLISRMYLSWQNFSTQEKSVDISDPREKDLPYSLILLMSFIFLTGLFYFFHTVFPLKSLGVSDSDAFVVVGMMVLFVAVIGFLFSVITAYFSGMVGVTASPGSSVVIAGMLLIAWIFLSLANEGNLLSHLKHSRLALEAMTILVGSIVTGIAAIANDNTQDLKVGQLIGATPWKQQVMLLFGVLVSSLVIPPVMQVLFDVYGISGVTPRDGMDITQTLPAPVASLMAAITNAVFHHTLSWMMLLLGAGVMLGMIGFLFFMRKNYALNLPLLGIAIGMYLPISTSIPLLIGGAFAAWSRKRFKNTKAYTQKKHVGILIACGLVSGSAIMDVLLAIPFSLMHSPDALSLVGESWYFPSIVLGLLFTAWLGYWMMSRMRRCD